MWVLKVKDISWPWSKVIYIWKFKFTFLRNSWAILNQVLYVSFQNMEIKFYWNNNGHMSKMAAIPVYGKISLKILYPGTRGMITRILGI